MTITDIIAEARDLVDATSTSYPDAKILRRLTPIEREIGNRIINADGTWQFDDSNYTDLPVGSGTLTATQDLYTFAAEFLDFLWAKVKNADGTWSMLKPIDQSGLTYPYEDLLTDDGLPIYVDKVADDTIRLLPAPAAADVYDGVNIKFGFKRKTKAWEQSDIDTGTREPGFALNHIIMAYELALPEAIKYKKDRVGIYERKIDKLMKEIINHYGQREKDKPKVIRTRGILHR
jgi:hypothetical protein